jgi:hypothetical protein
MGQPALQMCLYFLHPKPEWPFLKDTPRSNLWCYLEKDLKFQDQENEVLGHHEDLSSWVGEVIYLLLFEKYFPSGRQIICGDFSGSHQAQTIREEEEIQRRVTLSRGEF